MKRFLSIILLLALAAGVNEVRAQSDNIIKQKAKQLPGANTQPGPPIGGATAAPAAPAMPATPAAPPAQPLSPEKQAQFDKFAADLGGIQPGSTVTADQKQTLETDLLTLANTGTKPSKPLVTKLAGDLSAALSGKTVKAADHGQLVRSLNVVVNSAKLSASQAATYVTSAQTALKNCGVAETDVQTVTADLQAIVTELQKSKPNLYR